MTRSTQTLRIVAGVAVAATLFAGFLTVTAQTGGTGGNPTGGTGCVGDSCTVKNPLNTPDFPALINKILQATLVIAVPVIVLFIIYSGFLFVTARGDTTQLQQARTNFLWVVIGSVVLLGASAIAAIIANTLKSFGVGT